MFNTHLQYYSDMYQPYIMCIFYQQNLSIQSYNLYINIGFSMFYMGINILYMKRLQAHYKMFIKGWEMNSFDNMCYCTSSMKIDKKYTL